MPFTASDICKYFLIECVGTFPLTATINPSFAIFLPPLGVFLEKGCGSDFLINILLTILGYIPGIIHALFIILKY